MNIAVFADVHGRVQLAFKLSARWQQETGERIDLILQAGDLGAFPDETRLDKATRRYAEIDPSELGFSHDFSRYDAQVAAVLAETQCNLIFVRGNHEDQQWLDGLERQSESDGPLFPVDAYQRVYCLKTGVPYVFTKDDESISILGVGRVGAPTGEHDLHKPKYIQPYEQERLYSLSKERIDVLLTHDDARDGMIAGSGIEEIGLLLTSDRPAYHFFGHYGGPCLQRIAANGVTQVCKLPDLHWDPADRSKRLEADGMAILRWKSLDEHALEIVRAPWLREYSASTWRHL